MSPLATGASSSIAPPTTVVAALPPHADWSYSGDTGPSKWADLNAGFALCKTGSAQSPIDLPLVAGKHGVAPARPKWDPVPLQVTNTGHSIQVDDSAASSFVVDGTMFKLVQFHFHSPAEHTLAGKSFDLEMHLVHKSNDGTTLVVGLLFATGTENAVLASVLRAMPAHAGPAVTVPGASVDVQSLLPAAPRYLRYAGSLTVPPCTEGITWLVVEPDPVMQVSAEQVRKLRLATQPATNRPVQPLGGREVVELTY